MTLLYVSSKVEARLTALTTSGRAGRSIARKAARIIESLAAAGQRTTDCGSYTKKGERRLRGCRKFDLGCGYRLITLKRGPTLAVSFLGTHDECHRWLEGSGRSRAVGAAEGRTVTSDAGKRKAAVETPAAHEDGHAKDPEPLPQPTDTELRHVFAGLVAGRR